MLSWNIMAYLKEMKAAVLSGGWKFINVYKPYTDIRVAVSRNNIAWLKELEKTNKQTNNNHRQGWDAYRSILCDVDGVYGYMNI